MAVSMIPVGPGIPSGIAAVLRSMQDAVKELQTPTAPALLAHVDTAAHLTAKYPAASYKGGYLICDDINAIVHSTSVAGTWTWLRADGSAL